MILPRVPVTAVLRLACAFVLMFPLVAASQAPAPQHGCDSPESRQLDFWIGEWGLAYAGGLEDGRMTFAREASLARKKFHQRMVFSDVKAESLKWLWQRSDDGAKSWKTTWEIDYKRLR